jgi:hypothetical protein
MGILLREFIQAHTRQLPAMAPPSVPLAIAPSTSVRTLLE